MVLIAGFLFAGFWFIQTRDDLPLWVYDITDGSIFIGFWVGLVALTLFENKGQPRRVPIWIGVALAILAAIFVPTFMDKVTGVYQNASLRADVNSCARRSFGAATLFTVTNSCDFDIAVGLCLPGETNPQICAQSALLKPNENVTLDTRGTPLSSMPMNANGHTFVACRSPHRPSCNLKVTARGYEGVCLPAA